MPHKPYTIDGMAASSSVRKTSGRRSGSGHNSEMKIAMPRATGAAMRSASAEE